MACPGNDDMHASSKTLRKFFFKKNYGVREARTLDLRITRFSYETYALANCATTPLMSLREITSDFNLSTRERRPATNTATVMSEGHEIISS
jgi:hypothetical protein